jgi:hypothetical protein
MDTVAIREHKTSQGVPAAPRPPEPAHIIRDDAEAVAVAKRLAASFEKAATIGDRDRIWPVAELDAFSQSGLWSINVPRAFGGPEGSYAQQGGRDHLGGRFLNRADRAEPSRRCRRDPDCFRRGPAEAAIRRSSTWRTLRLNARPTSRRGSPMPAAT